MPTPELYRWIILKFVFFFQAPMENLHIIFFAYFTLIQPFTFQHNSNHVCYFLHLFLRAFAWTRMSWRAGWSIMIWLRGKNWEMKKEICEMNVVDRWLNFHNKYIIYWRFFFVFLLTKGNLISATFPSKNKTQGERFVRRISVLDGYIPRKTPSKNGKDSNSIAIVKVFSFSSGGKKNHQIFMCHLSFKKQNIWASAIRMGLNSGKLAQSIDFPPFSLSQEFPTFPYFSKMWQCHAKVITKWKS